MDYDVLVIDDDEKIRKLFSAILNQANYSVSEAASGDEGLRLLDTNTYQLILLDLKMPGMSGSEVLREIRKRNTNIPVYIVTAFHYEYFEELKSLREDGLEFQILNKPIAKDMLLSVLGGLISRKVSGEDPLTELRLFVVDKSKRTESIISNLHEIFQGKPKGKYSLEIINVMDDPVLAERDEILATPTLLRVSPEPSLRIIGDLSLPDRVLHGLDLAK